MMTNTYITNMDHNLISTLPVSPPAALSMDAMRVLDTCFPEARTPSKTNNLVSAAKVSLLNSILMLCITAVRLPLKNTIISIGVKFAAFLTLSLLLNYFVFFYPKT